jgi:phage recombination protein Bet
MTDIQKLGADKLALIKRTVAKDCTDDEFRLFVHMCQAVGLDPLRRQAMAFVYNKKDPAKRQLTVVTSIGGYRSIAERTGNYRPDDQAPRYTMGAKDEKANPLGIESCEVTVYKFSHGQWWPVVGQAFWDEYVPLRDGEIDRLKQGWIKMPRIMIAKCAEAAALRKAWPDDFASVHAEEETHREESLDVVEAIQQAEQKERLDRIGGPALITDWMDGNELQRVPVGQFHDAAMAFLRTCEGQPATARAWADRNRHALKEFWTTDKAAALSIKQEMERIESQKVVELQVDAPKAKPAAEQTSGSGKRRMAKTHDQGGLLL